jgi:hypothetical protein
MFRHRFFSYIIYLLIKKGVFPPQYYNSMKPLAKKLQNICSSKIISSPSQINSPGSQTPLLFLGGDRFGR